MWEIIIKGLAKTDYVNLEELDGIECSEDFVDNIVDEFDCLQSGFMEFKYEKGELYTITKYTSEQELNEKQLKRLKDYTVGQWSDGIGEGFEQEPCYYTNDGDEIYISPWFRGQVVEVEQIKIA